MTLPLKINGNIPLDLRTTPCFDMDTLPCWCPADVNVMCSEGLALLSVVQFVPLFP